MDMILVAGAGGWVQVKSLPLNSETYSEMSVASKVSQLSLLISYKTQMLEFMTGQADLNGSSELCSKFLALDS